MRVCVCACACACARVCRTVVCAYLAVHAEVQVVGRNLKDKRPRLCPFRYRGLVDGRGEEGDVVIHIWQGRNKDTDAFKPPLQCFSWMLQCCMCWRPQIISSADFPCETQVAHFPITVLKIFLEVSHWNPFSKPKRWPKPISARGTESLCM